MRRPDRALTSRGPGPGRRAVERRELSGEGLHLLGTSYSRVIGNQVSGNVGGILVSDGGLPTATGGPTSVGPAAHNVIAFDKSSDNAFDCTDEFSQALAVSRACRTTTSRAPTSARTSP